MSDLSAFVLAGGQSSRMSREKAFLELDGRSLLARALELAAAVAGEACIIGPREKVSSFGRVVEDIYPGRGPLGGIHAALSSSQSELNLILAVDTPFVRPEFLQYLVAQARAGGALLDGNFDYTAVAYRNRPVRKRMRTHRDQCDPGHIRLQDRAIGRKRVGRGPCRCGHDNAAAAQ